MMTHAAFLRGLRQADAALLRDLRRCPATSPQDARALRALLGVARRPAERVGHHVLAALARRGSLQVAVSAVAELADDAALPVARRADAVQVLARLERELAASAPVHQIAQDMLATVEGGAR